MSALPTVLGPGLCLAMNVMDISLVNPQADKAISVAFWMVIWWVFEVVSISVTALIPLIIFPILGIMPFKEVTANYGSPIVFLFLGGFLLALGMEKVQLHKRIALKILQKFGTSPNGILMGFIVATSFLSMWVSNTATTLVLMPIGLTVVNFISKIGQPDGSENKLKVGVLIAIAFAANIGGTATIIGTPPNVVLVGFMEETMKREVDFFAWMTRSLPFALIMLGATYFIVKKTMNIRDSTHRSTSTIIEDELDKLGKFSKGELKVSIAFIITIIMWVFRNQLNHLTGLSLSNGEVAMIGGFSMFVIPVLKEGYRSWLMEWSDTKNMHWGILIMFGGGLALANAFSKSGLIQYIGDLVTSNGFSGITVVITLVVVMTAMTTLMSNVALMAVFSPILLGIANGAGMDFIHLGLPMALASSCAFMLPMSTPPNAIVYASGFIKVVDMLKVGFLLNVVSVILLVVMGYLLMQLS